MLISLAGKELGAGKPVFIIAEAGVNHNGDIALAKKLIDVAKDAGADAVKFQTFTADTLVTADAQQAAYQTKNIGKKETQHEMLKRLELSKDAHKELAGYAKQRDIIFLSTPFSEDDADFLEPLVPAYKIPSGELTNTPYLEHLAKKGKPLIVSTGMSDLQEVEESISAIKKIGNEQIILLHSTSNYPPSDESLNLRVLTTLRENFGLPVGYSDNGHGTVEGDPTLAPIIATALGACVIEKHFTLDKTLPGPDHKASLTPQQLKEMIQAIRKTTTLLGSPQKYCTEEEKPIRDLVRKSLVAQKDIPTGVTITADMITTKRPGTGISPKDLKKVVGKKTKFLIQKGTVLQWSKFL